ncbi:hypothetical protein NE237_008319 [Protea cynaroides]|uniref:Uncharacterized protein n=1 Tax=Protea cynaroides TaxID=273540 RepID=A0A9Q0KVS7_9MAGN|nr:hypothetical protein NE237_008319 [Protea cynaroides]
MPPFWLKWLVKNADNAINSFDVAYQILEGVQMPKDMKFYLELPSNEIMKRADRADRAVFDLIDGLKVLSKPEVDLGRRLLDSERMLDDVVKSTGPTLRRMSYSKKNETLTKELEEMNDKVVQAALDRAEAEWLKAELADEKKKADEEQAQLTNDLKAERKKSDDLSQSKKVLEKTLWEYRNLADTTEEKIKDFFWKLQELEAAIPQKISQAFIEFKASDELNTFVSEAHKMEPLHVEIVEIDVDLPTDHEEEEEEDFADEQVLEDALQVEVSKVVGFEGMMTGQGQDETLVLSQDGMVVGSDQEVEMID